MPDATTAPVPGLRTLFAFVAGFLGALIFHQIALALLWSVGIAPFGPYSMTPTWPFGIPAVISLSFWGGVWGIVFALVERRFPPDAGYWLAAFLFGAIAPTLVALLVVVPLKGGPLGADWQPRVWLMAFLINGAWGLGTGFVLRLLYRRVG